MSYAIAQKVFLIHDKPSEKEILAKSFRDSFQIFTMRVKNLGNLDRAISSEEKDSLLVMLDALLEARERIDMI